MSLLMGTISPQVSEDGQVDSLKEMRVYIHTLQQLENEDAANCEQALSIFKTHLRTLRQTNKSDTQWVWTLPLVDSSSEMREEFFSSLTRLLERQTSTVCRIRIFALLIELSAIEIAPPSGNVAQGIITSSSNDLIVPNLAAPPSFGYYALRVIRDTMPNVVGARDLFLACIEDPFQEVLSSMSMSHLVSLFQLFLDIFDDPYFGSMIRTDPEEAENLYELLMKPSDCFKKVFLNLLAKLSPQDGMSRSDARALIYAMQQCGKILSIIALSPASAQYIHGDGVFTALLFSNWRLLQRIDMDEKYSHESFFFFRLIGRLCLGSQDIANYMSGGDLSQTKTEFTTWLIDKYRGQPEQQPVQLSEDGPGGNAAGVGSPSQPKWNETSYSASWIYCLACLLTNSERACALIKDKREGMKKVGDYWNFLFKWIGTYDNGDFLHACIYSLLLLVTKTPGLKTWKSAVDEKSTIVPQLHRIFARLYAIPLQQLTIAHRNAMLAALELLTYYSSLPKVSSALDTPTQALQTTYGQQAWQQWYRMNILRNILKQKHETILIDNEVKLAAAVCMSQVKMSEIDKETVRLITSLLKDSPPNSGMTMNACMTRIVYLAFRMAVYHGDDDEADPLDANGSTSSSSSSSSGAPKIGDGTCGDMFRKEATEACAAIYSTLEHGIVDDASPIRVDSITQRYRLGMIKLLMTAWTQIELRSTCESKGSIDVMVKALRAEQNALRWAKLRHERLIAAGRCVDCEEELVKNKFPTPTRVLTNDNTMSNTSIADSNIKGGGSISSVLSSIRCQRCSSAQQLHQNKSVLHETYTPLYFEQTWSGHDITAILDTLKQLHDIDIISFRILHQCANILEGTNYRESVRKLSNVKTFQDWNLSLPGRTLEECQQWEKQEWSGKEKKIRWKEMREYPILPANKKHPSDHLGSLAELQVEYYSSQYHYRESDVQRQVETQRTLWQQALEAAEKDERVYILVAMSSDDPDARVVGYIFGGPLRESTWTTPNSASAASSSSSSSNAAAAVDNDPDSPYCEVYGMATSSRLTDSESSLLQRRLLGHFSSHMRSLGYVTCITTAHRSERALYAIARGVDPSLPSSSSTASLSRPKSKITYPGAAPTSMGGSNLRDFIFAWSLNENIWRSSRAHDEFMSRNGLQLLIEFILRDTIKLHQIFHSTIRDTMEEFGEDLQDSLRQHVEMMKNGGLTAGGLLKNGENADGTNGAAGGKSTGETNAYFLDYSTQLPPPLPVDAYDLGDSPLSGSGILSLLNSREDHLYKHIFPLLLQNRFRASDQEFNRSEESIWEIALLGSTQENLLTLAANYASVQSVYDESTWSLKGNGNGSGSMSAAAKKKAAALAAAAAKKDGKSSNITVSTTSEADLLKHQAESACSSIFRAFYTLVVSGSSSIRRKSSNKLRQPQNFYAIRCLMASFHYGIRSNILDPPSKSYMCAMTCNFLSLMTELLPELVVGTEEGLECLQIYECFLLVLADLLTSLMSLLRSRNEHAKDPMHSRRRLTYHEEKVMLSVVNLLHLILSQIQSLTLFPVVGDTTFLVRCNTETRLKAINELFLTRKPLFQHALFCFLIYDLEALPPRTEVEEEEIAELEEKMEEEKEEYGLKEKYPTSLPKMLPRSTDHMRIKLQWIFSTFFHVSPAYQRDWLHQYHTYFIQLHSSGIRLSLLHNILACQQQLMLRDKLYARLMAHGDLQQDEFILDHAISEFSTSESLMELSLTTTQGLRILILTNKAYYVSKTIPAGEEGWSWLDRFTVTRYAYHDLRSISLLYGGQAIQLVRYNDPAKVRVKSEEFDLVYSVFTLHQLGLSERILNQIALKNKDDYGCAMTFTPDYYTRPSLIRLYTSLGMNNPSSLQERFLSHINIRRKGSMVARVAVWLQQGASAGDATLLVLEIDSTQYTKEFLDKPEKEIYPVGVKFALNTLKSVDFPDDSSGMILGFPEANLHIIFHDDASRELWRGALKEVFKKENSVAATASTSKQAKMAHATKLL